MITRLSSEDVETAAAEYFKGILFEPLQMTTQSWIAGGCLREWLLEKRLSRSVDIDVWSVDDAERQRLDAAAKAAGWTEKKSSPTSSNWKSKSGHWVQFIRGHHFESPAATISKFDFTVCAIALSANGEMLMHESTLIDMTLKRLMIVDLTFPLSTLKRAFKYRDKGFKICNEQLELLVASVAVEWVKQQKQERARREAAGDTSAGENTPPRYPWRGLD